MKYRVFIFLAVILYIFEFGRCQVASSYDVIVVGLGSAGTSAASELARAGKRVLALEAQGRIGGRVHSVPFGNGLVEVGAEWIHGEHPSRVYDLAIANNISIIRDVSESVTYRSDGTEGDSKLIEELSSFCLDVRPEDRNETVGKLITRKLMEYLRQNRTEILNDQDFIQNFLTYMNLLVDNLSASNDWDDIGTYTDYETPSGFLYWSWHRYGYKTFFEILLNTFNNGPGLPTLDIKLSSEVALISWSPQSDNPVTVITNDGTNYTADAVIVTPSLGVLKAKYSTLFSPPLPQNKVEAIQKIPFGVVGKIIVSFDVIWWDASVGSFEFLWRSAELSKIPPEQWWITRVFSAHRPRAANNTLTLWTNGEVAKMVETLPEIEVKTAVTLLLRQFLGANTTIPMPSNILRSTWYANPFTRGTYSFDSIESMTGVNQRDVLAEPLLDRTSRPRVLFAGEATNAKQYSTVHGASESGFREAARLLA